MAWKINTIDDKREALARLFRERGYVVGAEIGVDKGLYSEVLCRENPGVKLFCIDPWKVYRKYADIKDPHDMEKRFFFAQRRLQPYNCIFMRQSSMAAVKSFAPESLDFVYIDANHAYEYVLQDCNEWSRVVRVGGIVSGHDYTTRRHKNVGYDVKRAVEEHVSTHNVDTLYVFAKQGSSTWYYDKK